MRAAYNITFDHEYEPGIFKRVTREYHIPVTDIEYPLLGCFDLERAMNNTFYRHFKNMKYVHGYFVKFKTSRNCRKAETYCKVYNIRKKQYYFCQKGRCYRTQLLEYDTKLSLGFCPQCKRLVKLEGE